MEPSPRLEAAERKADAAEADLRSVRQQKPEVDRLGHALRGHLDRNHFGERLELSIRRKKAT